MPRLEKAMKDVAICDKSRGADKQALIREFPNGATHPGEARISWVLIYIDILIRNHFFYGFNYIFLIKGFNNEIFSTCFNSF